MKNYNYRNISITINKEIKIDEINYYTYLNFYNYIKKYDYEILKEIVNKSLKNVLKLNEFENIEITSNNLISFEFKTNDKKLIKILILNFYDLFNSYLNKENNENNNIKDIKINTNLFINNLINNEYNNIFLSENKKEIIKKLYENSIKEIKFLYENLIFYDSINLIKVDPIILIENLKEY